MNLYSLLDLHPDIFDDVKLPDGIDYETAINSILDSCGIYHFRNHDYPFCKALITSWFKRWYNAFDRINKATTIEYDLIQNYDRTQEYTRTVKRSDTTNEQMNGTDTGRVSAFNESAFQDDNQTESTGTTDTTRNGDETETINNREYGDIGVDTTAQKIIAEINFRSKKECNIYYVISELFFSEFMLRCI